MDTFNTDDTEQLLVAFIQAVEELLAADGFIIPVAIILPCNSEPPRTLLGEARFDVSAQERFKAEVAQACTNARGLFVAVELEATREAPGVIPVVEVGGRMMMIRVDHVERGSHVFKADITTEDGSVRLGPWTDAPMFSDKFSGLLPSTARG